MYLDCFCYMMIKHLLKIRRKRGNPVIVSIKFVILGFMLKTVETLDHNKCCTFNWLVLSVLLDYFVI